MPAAVHLRIILPPCRRFTRRAISLTRQTGSRSNGRRQHPVEGSRQSQAHHGRGFLQLLVQSPPCRDDSKRRARFPSRRRLLLQWIGNCLYQKRSGEPNRRSGGIGAALTFLAGAFHQDHQGSRVASSTSPARRSDTLRFMFARFFFGRTPHKLVSRPRAQSTGSICTSSWSGATGRYLRDFPAYHAEIAAMWGKVECRAGSPLRQGRKALKEGGSLSYRAAAFP
jgi:hypothetical protein